MDVIIYNLPYKLYFKGYILESDINLFYSPREKFFSEEALKIIENKWNELKNKSPSSEIYDGDLFELIDVKENSGKLDLYFDYTKYRYTIASRSKEYVKCVENGDYSSNHISIPTIIRTSDNKFPIGSDLKLKNNKPIWKFVGGYWEKSALTIFDNVKKECEEEIGLGNHISDCKVLGIASNNHATYIITFVDCSLTSEEIIEYLEKNRENISDSSEMTKINFIDLKYESIDNLINDDSIYLGGGTRFSLYSLKNNINNI